MKRLHIEGDAEISTQRDLELFMSTALSAGLPNRVLGWQGSGGSWAQPLFPHIAEKADLFKTRIYLS